MFVFASLALHSESEAAIIGGVIDDVSISKREVTITRKDGSKLTFKLQSSTRVTLDSKPTRLSSLKSGMAVSVYTSSGGLVLKVNGRSATGTKPGKPTPPPNRPETGSPKPTSPDPADMPDRAASAGESPGSIPLGDWPQFRGPDRANRSLEKNLLQSWPSGGPRLIWTAEGLGEGFSAVSVSSGRIYTMGNVGGDERIFCLDLQTGRPIWSQRNGNAFREGAGNGPRSTPTVDGETVYALGANGDLAAYNAISGQPGWRLNILETFGGKNITWGICESVLIDGDRLVCTPGGQRGTMVSLNKMTGRPIWTSQVPGGPQAAYASPVVSIVGGIRQYVNFTSKGVVGIKADDGTPLWGDDGSSNDTANCSSPIVADNLVFSASNYGKGAALVRLQGSRSRVQSERVYHTRDMKNHHGGMVLVDRHLYGSNDGILTCLDFNTGNVAWRQRTGKGSVVYADGQVVFRSEEGPVTMLAATPTGFQETGRFDQPARSGRPAWPHPVVAQGKLFLRDQDKLLCYSLR